MERKQQQSDNNNNNNSFAAKSFEGMPIDLAFSSSPTASSVTSSSNLSHVHTLNAIPSAVHSNPAMMATGLLPGPVGGLPIGVSLNQAPPRYDDSDRGFP
jgi:hypothetical protein